MSQNRLLCNQTILSNFRLRGTVPPACSTFQSELTPKQEKRVKALLKHIRLGKNANRKKTLRFEGVNVQIVNGRGGTISKNGAGNLIVGYDETVAVSGYDTEDFEQIPVWSVCSEPGYFMDPVGCASTGGTTSSSHKSGSHNVVVGAANNYSQYGGLVAGYKNSITGPGASLIGGAGNVSNGYYTSVAGGQQNMAAGKASQELRIST